MNTADILLAALVYPEIAERIAEDPAFRVDCPLEAVLSKLRRIVRDRGESSLPDVIEAMNEDELKAVGGAAGLAEKVAAVDANEVRDFLRTTTPVSGEFGDTSITASAPGAVLVRGDEIELKPVEWLWLHWLARGKLHVLAGQAGIGKTIIVLALLAIITRGLRWPDGAPGCDPAHILIWSAEDSAADTLAPRLKVAGADMSRVHIISGVGAGEARRAFDPATDLDQLIPHLHRLRPAALMVDPIVSAVGGDSHKNAETRRSLQPLVDLAEQFGMAVFGVSHFSKGTTGREPLERVTGSLAFGALARIVLAAAKLPPDNPHGVERTLARAKSNIGPDDGAIGYRLVITEAAPGIEVAAVEWQRVIEGTARELLAEPEHDEEDGALGEARAFLEDILSCGPLAVKDILTNARQAGISDRTLKRAKAVCGVKATKTGLHSGWVWSLPTVPTMPTVPEECHHKSLAPFEQFEVGQQFELASFGEMKAPFDDPPADDLPSFDF